MLCAFLWLYPVFNEPELNVNLTFNQRVLRTIYLFFLLPIVYRKLIFNIRFQKIIQLFLIALLPSIFLASILSLNFSFIISTTVPIIFSILGILILTSLEYIDFIHWLKAVSLISLIFFIIGIIKYGFVPSDYFGRPRVHFGFTHPVQTASAILAVFAPYTLLPNNLNKTTNLIFKLLLLIFLFLAQSINIFISVVIINVFSYFIKNNYNKYFVFFLSFFLFLSPFTIYFANYLPQKYQDIINIFTSGRLNYFTETLLFEFKNDNIFNMLFGPMYELRQLNLNTDVSRGFSFIDSVFFSFLFSFGFLGFISFLVFLYYLLINSYNKNKYSFQLITGLIFFYSADSQGFTPNNLVYFSILAYIIKANFKKHENESKFILS